MADTFLSLPCEIKLAILEAFDPASLYHMSLTCRAISALAIPMLWDCIDLTSASPTCQRRFFGYCDRLLTESPNRWHTLASLTRSLLIGSLETIFIYVLGDDTGDNPASGPREYSPTVSSTVWELIQHFINLETLSLYPCEPLDVTIPSFARFFSLHFPKLKKLIIGGNIARDRLLGILGTPEMIRELSCIALRDGRLYGPLRPDGLLFLPTINHRFTSLRRLHLCKLVELCDIQLWDWDLWAASNRERDCAILEEWKAFLSHVSPTLISLILEDRFLVPEELDEAGIGERVNPQVMMDGGPGNWTRASNERFKKILLPVLAEQEWSQLKTLTLIGLDPRDKNAGDDSPLDHLQPRVKVRYELGYLSSIKRIHNRILINAPTEYF